MKQIVLKKGLISVKDVATPIVESGNLLIKVVYSCISAGTEMSVIADSRKTLLERIRQKPENIKKAIALIKRKGVTALFKTVEKMQEEEKALGYSISGIVIGVGEGVREFSVGDRIAAAGAGIANHSEFVSVPQNLVVKVPEGVSLKDASSVALGSIAMQGVRRTDLRLGEICVVVGAGIMGLLAIQMLHASGVRVIAVDYSEHRLKIAEKYGAELCVNPKTVSQLDAVNNFTAGYGADAVLFAAATSGDSAISQAFKMCKRKGKVVLLGVTGLNIDRNDMYNKELDFQISTSYGPGRYDANYEMKGMDYPYGYVRWTEGRNMAEFLRLIAVKQVDLSGMIEGEFPFEEAQAAFAELQKPNRPLIVVLNYGEVDFNEYQNLASETRNSFCPAGTFAQKQGRLNIAFIGIGSFAEGMHIPNLQKLSDRYSLYAACAHNGLKVKSFAEKYHMKYGTTKPEDIFADPDVDVVLIATRHDSHAQLAMQALKAGKHVFVEKPMGVTLAEIDEIYQLYQELSGKGNAPQYMVGFNRRFSPMIQNLKKHLANRIGPVQIDYSINAGFIPAEHWTHEAGGRIIGEGCHFIDLAQYIAGQEASGITGCSAGGTDSKYLQEDNKFIVLQFPDRSAASIRYFTTGNPDFPKEQLTVCCDGKVYRITDYKVSRGWGVDFSQEFALEAKGHLEELAAFADAVQNGKMAIDMNMLYSASQLAICASQL